MTCFGYALRAWWRHGGYLMIRRSHGIIPYPHFMWADSTLRRFSHYVPINGVWKIRTYWRVPDPKLIASHTDYNV